MGQICTTAALAISHHSGSFNLDKLRRFWKAVIVALLEYREAAHVGVVAEAITRCLVPVFDGWDRE
jgi:hypothetical protein